MVSNNKLFVNKVIEIYSYHNSVPHREIIVLSHEKTKAEQGKFVIYDAPKVYSKQYQELLKDFFTIF